MIYPNLKSNLCIIFRRKEQPIGEWQGTYGKWKQRSYKRARQPRVNTRWWYCICFMCVGHVSALAATFKLQQKTVDESATMLLHKVRIGAKFVLQVGTAGANESSLCLWTSGLKQGNTCSKYPGKLTSLHRSRHSNEDTFCALGVVGISNPCRPSQIWLDPCYRLSKLR